jgi:hypothetical protein
MPDFSHSTPSTFTPTTTNPVGAATNAGNYTLVAGPTTVPVVGTMGKVKYVTWGGAGTTSTGYRTRWARCTTDPVGNFTPLTFSKTSPVSTATCAPVLQWVTSGPTVAAEPANLFAISWNVLGGGGILVLPIGSEWMVVGSATIGTSYITCINTAGTDANISTYGIQWSE